MWQKASDEESNTHTRHVPPNITHYHTTPSPRVAQEIGHTAKTPRPQVQQHRAVEAGAHLPPTSAERNTVQINGEEKGLK